MLALLKNKPFTHVFSVLVQDLSLLDLTDTEKEALSFVSLNKLQEISLGVPVRIPTGKKHAIYFKLNNDTKAFVGQLNIVNKILVERISLDI